MAKHLELSVNIKPGWEEFVSEVLIEKLGCTGTVVNEVHFDDGIAVENTNPQVKGYIWVDKEVLFDVDGAKNILQQEKKRLMSIKELEPKGDPGSWELQYREIQEQAWAHNWKKFWHPMKIGSKIWICPSWEKCDAKDGEEVITLDPGSAFGTGTHQTTRLCILALEKYLMQNEKVADIGMGSGILSLAALKLGAKNVIGVDNDPSVIEVAKENAKINNLHEKCKFSAGSAVDVKGKFEVVVANILANILIDIMDDLDNLLEKGSKLILSGINKEKVDDVLASVNSKRLNLLEIIEEDNWVAIVVEK